MSLLHTKFSAIAHSTHALLNPIGLHKVDRTIEMMQLGADARVVDIGCGKAEVLIRIGTRYGCEGLGVDLNPHFVEAARAAVNQRVPEARIRIVQSEGADAAGTEPWDLAVAMGCRPFGDTYAATLNGLRQLVRPGGLLLVGEGHWTTKPNAEVLSFLDCRAEDQVSHANNILAGVQAGLTPLYACVASEDEWDHYEWRYKAAMERYCDANPEDPDTPVMRERIRGWNDAAQRLLRGVLGFGLYLFQTPGATVERQ